MKACVFIDVPENFDFEKNKVTVTTEDGKEYNGNLTSLKTNPEKKGLHTADEEMFEWQRAKAITKLKEKIHSAMFHVSGELEIQHRRCSGWYAMDYKEDSGGVFSINQKYDEEPLISDLDVMFYNIDMNEILGRMGVYVSEVEVEYEK